MPSDTAGTSTGANSQRETRQRAGNGNPTEHTNTPQVPRDNDAGPNANNDNGEPDFPLLLFHEFDLNGRPTGGVTNWPGEDEYGRGRGRIHVARINFGNHQHEHERPRPRGHARTPSDFVNHFMDTGHDIEENGFIEYLEYLLIFWEQVIIPFLQWILLILLALLCLRVSVFGTAHGIQYLWKLYSAPFRPDPNAAATPAALNDTLNEFTQGSNGPYNAIGAKYPRDVAKLDALPDGQDDAGILHGSGLDAHPLEQLLNLTATGNFSASATSAIEGNKTTANHLQVTASSVPFASPREHASITGLAADHDNLPLSLIKDQLLLNSREFLKLRREPRGVFENGTTMGTLVFSSETFGAKDSTLLTASSLGFTSPAESGAIKTQPSNVASASSSHAPSFISPMELPGSVALTTFTAADSKKLVSTAAAFKSPFKDENTSTDDQRISLYTLTPEHSPSSTTTLISTHTITITVEKSSPMSHSGSENPPASSFVTRKQSTFSITQTLSAQSPSSQTTFFSSPSIFIPLPYTNLSSSSSLSLFPLSSLPLPVFSHAAPNISHLSTLASISSILSRPSLLPTGFSSAHPSPSPSTHHGLVDAAQSAQVDPHINTTTAYWPTATSLSAEPGYDLCYNTRLNVYAPCTATGNAPTVPTSIDSASSPSALPRAWSAALVTVCAFFALQEWVL